METPLLTKKQIKSTLSAKKTRTKSTLKNVLSSSYQKYWPLLDDMDTEKLGDVLQKNLPKVINDKLKVPWREVRNVPKGERKKFRHYYYMNNGISRLDNDIERNSVIFGINDVTKALENHDASAVLISGDVQPKLIVEHVIDQCAIHKIPVLLLPTLRSILKSTCGITSMVIALKNNHLSSKIEAIIQLLKILYQKYLPSEKYIHQNLINNDKVQVEEKMEVGESAAKEVVDVSKFYLRRDSTNSRVFVPTELVGSTQTDSSVIELDCSTNSLGPKSGLKRKYNSLKVKRFKGDENRIKKKIAKLKNNKK